MSFAGNLENVKQDIANTLDVFSKEKEFIEQAEVKLKKSEEELKERERKIEEKEKEFDIRQKIYIDEKSLIGRSIALDERETNLKIRQEAMDEEEARLKRWQQELLEKEKNNATTLNTFKDNEESSIIYLNVGGRKFVTSLITLRSEQGSVLEKMFSGEFDLKREKDGSVFIDRSGEHFHFILDYLRGNISEMDNFLFDENTRKSLIKEAEYYQLDKMKNILSFKSTALTPVDYSKAEIIDIVEKVVNNKEALRNILSDIDGNVRREKRKKVADLKLVDSSHTIYRGKMVDMMSTSVPMNFEYAQWDYLTFDKIHFENDIYFKNCSFLQTTFKNCIFGKISISKQVNIKFHNCDLIFTDFSSSSFIGVVDFDGSDLRCANFKEIEDMDYLIDNDKVKITNAKYVQKAHFDENAMRVITGSVQSFHI